MSLLPSRPNSSRHCLACDAIADSAEIGYCFMVYMPQSDGLPYASRALRMIILFAYRLYFWNKILFIALGRCLSSLICFLRASQACQFEAPFF